MIGRIGKVIKFDRTVNDDQARLDNTTLDMGGQINNNIEGEQFTDPGEDSQPLPIDYAMLHPTVEDMGASGIVLGYQDIKTEKKSLPGEKRIYARDEDGNVVCEVHLKNGGEISIFNGQCTFIMTSGGEIYMSNTAGGNIEMQAGGDVIINGTTFKSGGVIESTSATFSGNVEAADFIAGAIQLLTHLHGGVTTGGANTGTPV